jgi:hypothetical protein
MNVQLKTWPFMLSVITILQRASGGDAAVVVAALCYSLTTVRIGFFAARLRPLQLALAKSTGLAALAAGVQNLTARVIPV